MPRLVAWWTAATRGWVAASASISAPVPSSLPSLTRMDLAGDAAPVENPLGALDELGEVPLFVEARNEDAELRGHRGWVGSRNRGRLRRAEPLGQAQTARNVVIQPERVDDVLLLQLARVEGRGRLATGLAPASRDVLVNRVRPRE